MVTEFLVLPSAQPFSCWTKLTITVLELKLSFISAFFVKFPEWLKKSSVWKVSHYQDRKEQIVYILVRGRHFSLVTPFPHTPNWKYIFCKYKVTWFFSLYTWVTITKWMVPLMWSIWKFSWTLPSPVYSILILDCCFYLCQVLLTVLKHDKFSFWGSKFGL